MLVVKAASLQLLLDGSYRGRRVLLLLQRFLLLWQVYVVARHVTLPLSVPAGIQARCSCAGDTCCELILSTSVCIALAAVSLQHQEVR